MGLFDFFKKNKNLSNDNGLNEEYFNGNLSKRFHMKNGLLHGLYQNFSQGSISYEITYADDIKVSSKFYNNEGWVETTIKGNIYHLYKSKDELLSFDEILDKNQRDRQTVDEIREKVKKRIKERNDLAVNVALIPGVDLDSLAKTGLANTDVEAEVKKELDLRSQIEGVILKNDYTFIDDDFPNPIRPFTGEYDGSNYINGKKE